MSGKEVYIAKLGTLLSDVHCGACDHVTCIENQYRTGLCSGPTNGYNCNNCRYTFLLFLPPDILYRNILESRGLGDGGEKGVLVEQHTHSHSHSHTRTRTRTRAHSLVNLLTHCMCAHLI